MNTTDLDTGRVGYTTWRRARDLVSRGYAVPADGELRPGCKLILVQPEPRQSTPLPAGPGQPTDAAGVTVSHGDGLGGTRYSSDHATELNPQGVWYLKDLLARDAWLFRLSVTDNLRTA